MQLAYPGLAGLLPLLSISDRHGRRWRSVCDAYCSDLSAERVHALCEEVDDLFACGWDEPQLAVMAGLLGLETDFAGRECATVRQYLGMLEEHLSGEHLSRAAIELDDPGA